MGRETRWVAKQSGFSRRTSDLIFLTLDLTTHTMQAMFNAIADQLVCELCKQDLRARLKDVVVR